MTACTTIPSPIGDLLLTGEESATAHGGMALTALAVPEQGRTPVSRPGRRHDPGAFAEIAAQIGAYFDGRLHRFDIEFADSGTAFQRRVWDAVERIPYGTTTTYGKLAEQLGVAREDVRALGGAIGTNPLLLVRPCHRVIGTDGSLKGYAGGWRPSGTCSPSKAFSSRCSVDARPHPNSGTRTAAHGQHGGTHHHERHTPAGRHSHPARRRD